MRQERAAKRTKAAATQADRVISAAAEKASQVTAGKRCPKCGATGTVAALRKAGHGARCTAAPQIDRKKVNSPLAGARTRKAPASASVDSDADRAAEVVRLRDEEGLSWVQIGAKLGLPGSKSGAGNARKLYASTGASYRGTTAAKPARQPREPRQPKVKPETKTAAKVRVRGGDHLIPLDTPDPELVFMLRGHTIKWSIDVSTLGDGPTKGEPVWCEQEAVIHPDHLEVDRGEDGTEEPYLNFREMEANKDGRYATAFRTVRLAAVHEVV